MNNTHTTVSAFLISAALLFSACGGSTPDAGTPVSDDAPAVTETETPEATTQDGDDEDAIVLTDEQAACFEELGVDFDDPNQLFDADVLSQCPLDGVQVEQLDGGADIEITDEQLQCLLESGVDLTQEDVVIDAADLDCDFG